MQVVAQLIGMVLREAEEKGQPLSVRDATAAALRKCEGNQLPLHIYIYVLSVYSLFAQVCNLLERICLHNIVMQMKF